MTNSSRIVAGLVAIMAAVIGIAASPTLDGTVVDTVRETGRVADGTTVFDGDVAGVARLDRALLKALRRAAGDAEDDGVVVNVNSGWRSAGYQRQLLAEAVTQYGSEAEAARWVATPQTSPHVSGDAVDIGPYAAMDWFVQHGSDYGICQIYGNEPWHFELRPDAVDDGCPATYPDPTFDPRMQHTP